MSHAPIAPSLRLTAAGWSRALGLRPRWREMLSVAIGLVALVLIAMGATIGLYLVKSALGIDLLPGPSPLHNLLFPLLSWR